MSWYIKSWFPFSNDRHKNLSILTLLGYRSFRRPLFIRKIIYKAHRYIYFQGKKVLQFLFYIQYLLDLTSTPFLPASSVWSLIIPLFRAPLLLWIWFGDMAQQFWTCGYKCEIVIKTATAQRDELVDLMGISELVIEHILVGMIRWGFCMHIPAWLNPNYFFTKITG